MNVTATNRRSTVLAAFLSSFAIYAFAQTLDDCQQKCEDRYITEREQCRGDQHCIDRAIERRNECRYACSHH